MKYLVLTAYSLLVPYLASAQSENKPISIGLDVAASLFQEPVRTTFIYDDLSKNTVPTYILSADYRLLPEVSLGLQLSYLTNDISYTWAAKVTDAFFLNINRTTSYDDIAFRYNEASLMIQPLLHYVTKPKFDMYSGVRFGVLNAWANVKDGHPEFDVASDVRESFFTWGITLMGVQYFPKENLGVNFDMSIGKPYALGLGAVYRLW